MPHTPGPWEMTKLGTEPRKPDTYVIGRILPHHWTGIGEVKLSGCAPGSEENAANARLIAAAPELLAACEAAQEFLTLLKGTSHESDYVFFGKMNGITIDKLGAAIAKALTETS